LEYVGSERFTWVGDFQLYLAAARWAARFHAAVRDFPASSVDFLIQHDQTHYRHCGEHLEQNLSKFDTQQQQVIRQALDYYKSIIDHLTNLPRCIIHGEFFGANIVVRTDSDGQISVIDWETAAIASGYVDLVSISAGNWTPEQRQEMLRAYFEQYEAETGMSMDWASFCQDVSKVALYRALWWLNWWADHDSAHIDRWIQELEREMSNH
jgi:aminoglycoside phosphotransferase (APT) family kinase protein